MLSTNPYCPPDEPWEGKQTEANEMRETKESDILFKRERQSYQEKIVIILKAAANEGWK